MVRLLVKEQLEAAPPDLGEVCVCVMCYSKDVLSNTLRTAGQPLQEFLGGNVLVANTGIVTHGDLGLHKEKGRFLYLKLVMHDNDIQIIFI